MSNNPNPQLSIKHYALRIILGIVIIVSAGASFLYSQREAMIQKFSSTAAEYATKAIGTKVEIGSVKIGDLNTDSNSDLTAYDLAIYDKNSKLIAKADSANITFHLLTLASEPLSAIKRIEVNRADGNITKREDGSWNFSDIKTEGEGESKFDTDIIIDEVNLNVNFDDNEFVVKTPNVNLDFDTTAEFKVNVKEAGLTGEAAGNDIEAEKLNVELEFDHSNISIKADGQNILADVAIDNLINDDSQVTEDQDLNSEFLIMASQVEKKSVKVDNIRAAVDIDKKFNIKADAKARTRGSNIQATANITDNKQVFDVASDSINLDEVLPLIPENVIPSGVKILGGIINAAKINVVKAGDDLKFDGSANVQDGSVMVEQTQIEYINGSTSFNNAELLIDASAEANGQRAKVDGKIYIDKEEPYFDLNASSDSFSPNAVMYLPAEGTASFNAHLTGTPSNPVVEGDIYSPYITYDNLNASNVSTHMKYQDNGVYLTDLNANTFGGKISGDFELHAMDLSYNAHLKADSIDINQLTEFVPALSVINGAVSGDVGINGVSDDFDKLKVYGMASASNIYYENTPVDRIDASFIVEGDDIKIDYMSAALPNKGSIGAEGTITDGNKLDLKFYGAHVDLTAAENFIPNVAISGLADFEGSVHGDAVNPDVDIKFSAVDNSKRAGEHFKGILFEQPYDSLKITAAGSLDGVSINSFDMTKNGKDVWLAKGKVGFAGEKNIDLRVDTVGVRAETIMKLVAPDQPLTGNVDNVITITGTLDKPEVVGYIEMKRGSYRGMLVNSMAGDYYVDGNTIRLQDFHVNSPMVDMDLNGTIDAVTTDMDFTVAVYDIDVHRFQGKLPENYPASGHGKFSGNISGNLDHPIFDGTLTAETLSFNEVDITDVGGHVNVNGNDIILDNFSFKTPINSEENEPVNSQEGAYTVHGKVNYATNSMSGRSEVTNADIASLLALANLKNKIINGKLNSNIQFGGTLQNPSLQVVGTISEGDIAGYDIHDVSLNVNCLNRVVYINKLEGFQGDAGQLNAVGTVDLQGPLDIKLSASNLALGMFAKAGGVNANVVGTANLEAIIGGSVDNPTAEMEIIANGGGVNGTTFDLLKGNLNLKNGIVDVNEFGVQKAIGEKIYQVSAKGSVPLVSLTADKESKLQSEEQINLNISLDNADLSLLPGISEQYIAWALGSMAGNLKITGTASNPLINGSIEVIEGTTKIKGMKPLIEHMNMLLAFKGTEMNVENFSGNIGNGKYELTGGMKLAGLDIADYNFNFTANKLGIDSSFFSGPLNFEFAVNKEKTRFGTFPKISGHVDFDNCLISIPTLPDDESTMPPILMDVSINLGNKVHFYSPYLFDMYLTGNAHFEGTTEHPKPSGIISVKRGGTLNYLKTVFNIREGELQFNQPDTFFPTITFAAETKISKTRVYLSAGGTLKDRAIHLTSSPEMSETEIMQLLTLRDAYQKGGDNEIETGDILLLGLQMSFLSEIESAVRKTFGFDQFSISRGSGSAFDNKTEMRDRHEEEYNVSLGKYITDNVMMKYTRGIGGDNVNRYGLQYDFNDNISATAEREGVMLNA